MPKRRLQCGSCSTVIKVSSKITRPVCPRCSTAHTYIKCGRAECGTLMCLPENVNQFSCPRCSVQLARPGHIHNAKSPVAVRCGNTACDFMMTISANVGRFKCPRCSMEQVLPGSEEELKCKARMEEEARQQQLKRRQQLELSELCELFSAIDRGTIEAVYDSCDYNRTQTLSKLMEMSEGSTDEAQGEIAGVLALEVDRIEAMISYKKSLVDTNIRCPLSGRVMEDPVFAADGHSYERKEMEQHLLTSDVSPVNKKRLEHKMLVPNHQLRGQIQSWKESLETVAGSRHEEEEDLIPAVTAGPAAAAAGGAQV
mmetsp:Transcript_21763/g.50514  ORF Transcript_21763/g.50514 Transcript_21763/m.50514 type:complete len:313 (+) Transcript_21763:197-1135(+)